MAPGLLSGLALHKAVSLSSGKAEKVVSPQVARAQVVSLQSMGSSLRFLLPAGAGHPHVRAKDTVSAAFPPPSAGAGFT